MDADKRKRLEADGWKVGDADDFLGGVLEEVKAGVVQCDRCDFVERTTFEGRTLRDEDPCPKCGEGR